MKDSIHYTVIYKGNILKRIRKILREAQCSINAEGNTEQTIESVIGPAFYTTNVDLPKFLKSQIEPWIISEASENGTVLGVRWTIVLSK